MEGAIVAAVLGVASVLMWAKERRDRRHERQIDQQRADEQAEEIAELRKANTEMLARIAEATEALGEQDPGAHLSARLELEPQPPIETVFRFGTLVIANRGTEPGALDSVKFKSLHGITIDAGELDRPTKLRTGEDHRMRLRFRNGSLPTTLDFVLHWTDSRGAESREQNLPVI